CASVEPARGRGHPARAGHLVVAARPALRAHGSAPLARGASGAAAGGPPGGREPAATGLSRPLYSGTTALPDREQRLPATIALVPHLPFPLPCRCRAGREPVAAPEDTCAGAC